MQNRTANLWREFMPLRNKIPNRLNQDYISMQIYDPEYFNAFDPGREFIKWAAVQVSKNSDIPLNLDKTTIPGGTYAKFHYNGPAGNPSIFQYIYSEWLPASGYWLDQRPHFEILGPNYNQTSANSEEDIFIPVRKRPDIAAD